jgi:hypothetical protein
MRICLQTIADTYNKKGDGTHGSEMGRHSVQRQGAAHGMPNSASDSDMGVAAKGVLPVSRCGGNAQKAYGNLYNGDDGVPGSGAYRQYQQD